MATATSAPSATSASLRGHLHTERMVTVRDGVQLSVRDQGPSHAEATVVLLHGLCLEKGSWAGQIRHLTRQWGDRIRIISYDHRGHGGSDSAPKRTYTVAQLAEDLADVLTALRVSGRVTLAGHSMGGMVALAYLGQPPADRPVEPHGLILVATAAGRLAERGVARLLASPATDMLCGLAAFAPQRAMRMLTKPVCATLALGGHARSTLAALFANALAATTSLDPPSGSCPACGPTTKPPRSARSAPRRSFSAGEPTSSPRRRTRATWPTPSLAPHTSTFPWRGTCSFKRPRTPSRTPSAARSSRPSAPICSKVGRREPRRAPPISV